MDFGLGDPDTGTPLNQDLALRTDSHKTPKSSKTPQLAGFCLRGNLNGAAAWATEMLPSVPML